jgi:hypothetical protein
MHFLHFAPIHTASSTENRTAGLVRPSGASTSTPNWTSWIWSIKIDSLAEVLKLIRNLVHIDKSSWRIDDRVVMLAALRNPDGRRLVLSYIVPACQHASSEEEPSDGRRLVVSQAAARCLSTMPTTRRTQCRGLVVKEYFCTSETKWNSHDGDCRLAFGWITNGCLVTGIYGYIEDRVTWPE